MAEKLQVRNSSFYITGNLPPCVYDSVFAFFSLNVDVFHSFKMVDNKIKISLI